MNDNLAPVFLDNKPVTLKDPKPKLSAILSASGRPETTDVKWLQFQPNTPGKTVRSEEVLDRTTDPSKPIYLTSGKGQWNASQVAKPEAAFTAGKTPVTGTEPKQSQPTGGKTPDIPQSTAQDDDTSGMQDDTEAGGEPSKKSDDYHL